MSGRPTPNDRGAVTVESAVALSSLVLFLALAIAGLAAGADHVRCIDAAREAARLTARGERDAAKQVAADLAPAGALITITTEGRHIQVDIHATPSSGLLPGVELHAKAVAIREPDG